MNNIAFDCNGTLDKKEVLEIVSKQEIVVRAYKKLNCKSVDVEVPVNVSAIQMIESALAELKKSPSDLPEYKKQVAQAEQQLENLKSDGVKGTLVSLKAMDLLFIQGWVTEASLLGRDRGLDFDVQLFIMSKAEKCATIYLALRRRENSNERYFKSQEDVVLLDDKTLNEIAKIYADNFVLTEEERKNLYGAPHS